MRFEHASLRPGRQSNGFLSLPSVLGTSRALESTGLDNFYWTFVGKSGITIEAGAKLNW
jgi:hypothetical protein